MIFQPMCDGHGSFETQQLILVKFTIKSELLVINQLG